MSGFVALVSFDGRPVDPALLGRLTESLAARGPDGQATWRDDAVGLGFSKLVTTEEARREVQPLTLDGDVWIVADARIDGREALADELRQAGVDAALLRRAGDAALILHAYRCWGEDAPARLLGDFAFVIWERRRRTAFCARDHFGVKPLYYAEWPGGVAISNTLGCLRRHPRVSERLNPQAIGDFLLFDSNQDPETTTFADVRRLPPAHQRSFFDGGGRSRRYWSIPLEHEPRSYSDREWVERFRQLLQVAVADRLRGDRLAIFLSGGLDSTSVGALAQRLRSARGSPRSLHCFTGVYRRLIPDREGFHASLVARSLGLPIHLSVADDYRMMERWGELPLPPEPGDHVLDAFFYDVDRMVAEKARAVLTGHGGDVLLASSTGYFLDQLRHGRPDRALAYLVSGFYRIGKRPPLGLWSAWRRRRRRRRWRQGFPPWLTPDFVRHQRLEERWRWYWLERAPNPRHPTHADAHAALVDVDYSTFFEHQDAGARRRPFELRHPFFDLRLIEHVLAMPPAPWCLDKYVLREATRDLLPEAIRTRPKSPLAGNPHHRWTRSPSEAWTVQLREVPEIAAYVQPQAVLDTLRHDEAEGRIGRQHQIGRRPLNLAYWMRQMRYTTFRV